MSLALAEQLADSSPVSYNNLWAFCIEALLAQRLALAR